MRNRSDSTCEFSALRHQSIRRLILEQRGVAAVEFALVVPFLLAIVLGIVSFGLYIGAVHATAQLAADAARASVSGLSDSERIAIATQQVATNARSYLILDPTKITVNAGPLPTDVTEFQVQIKYDASTMPIWGLSSFLPLPAKTIIRTATVKRGGY